MAPCYYQAPTPGYSPQLGSHYDYVQFGGGGPAGAYVFAIAYQRNNSQSAVGPSVTVVLVDSPNGWQPLLPMIRYWWTSDPVWTPQSVNAEGFTYGETFFLVKPPGASAFTSCSQTSSNCEPGVYIQGQSGCDRYLGGVDPSIYFPIGNPCWFGPSPVEVACPPSTLLEVSFDNGRDLRFDDNLRDYSVPHWTR